MDTGTQFTFNVHKASWVESVSGTGAIADDTDGTTGELSIKLSPVEQVVDVQQLLK